MALEIIVTKTEHVPELARICFDAFGALHDRHSVPRDFDSPDIASMLMGMLTSRADFAGFAAVLDGRVVGSNFLGFSDAVAGVGPITVDPACQSKGIGKALMKAVMGEAERRGIRHVRLMQEAVNTTSLSLYTSLGFDWRDVAVVQIAPGAEDDASIRPLAEGDLPSVEALSKTHYHHSRHNEAAAAVAWHFPGLVRERAGKVRGYLFPGFFGHGFAETREDMLALVDQAGRVAPPPMRRVLVPLSEQDLYRALLARGGRTLKVLSYMTVGPYTPPREAWLPSIGN